MQVYGCRVIADVSGIVGDCITHYTILYID
jgi:hypothetical protein